MPTGPSSQLGVTLPNDSSYLVSGYRKTSKHAEYTLGVKAMEKRSQGEGGSDVRQCVEKEVVAERPEGLLALANTCL